jgi:hypothetical protein
MVAEHAARTYVFQRTPATVDVRDNRPTDPEWAASLTPGWQQRRMDNFLAIMAGNRSPRTSSRTRGPPTPGFSGR